MTATTAAFRFGFGLPLPQDAPTDPAAMMAALRGPDAARTRFAAPGVDMAVPVMAAMQTARQRAKKEPDKKKARKIEQAAVQAGNALAMTSAKAAFARAIDSPDGLRERLVMFWADHFTTVSRSRLDRCLPGTLVEDAIRPHLTGRFADMLQAVTFHPAMLLYLDQVYSIGPGSRRGKRNDKGLNENLARELLELHTLGVGADYGQDDVRQMAELLTGLTFTREKGYGFDGARVEPGPETVLGVTYDGEGEAPIRRALADLAVHPATARHIATKLAVHFVADQPDPALVAALERAFTDSAGDLGVVVETLLMHEAAWTAPAAKARQPFEFVVCALRGLGLRGDQIMEMKDDVFQRMVLNALRDMGQPFRAAPGPDGWPEEAEAWINPQRLAARITWAMEVPGRLVPETPVPGDFAARALGDRAGERLVWAAARSESLREGVGLVLASPEFNRR